MNNIVKKAYFAHSKLTYGSKEEHLCKIKISKLFQLFCPNEHIAKKNPQASHNLYNKAIDDCKRIVFIPYKGFIGKGVYSNVAYALSKKYPVYVYDSINDMLIKVISVCINDSTDWSIKYATYKTDNIEIL